MAPTDELLDMVTTARWDHFDLATRHAARRHLTDTLGVMVAGSVTDTVDRTFGALAVGGGATGGVPIPGRVDRLGMLDAAFLLGTAGHGIELDDGYREGTVHPGVCVVPAGLALAGAGGVAGTALLEAVVAGYETVIAVSRAAHPVLRERGFHPTAAAGVLGAAMAAGRLLGLDRVALGHALGIAAGNAGAVFASSAVGDVKRLDAGMAAAGGLRAALLAREGIQGPPAVIEGRDGWAQAFTGGLPNAFTVAPGGRYGIRDCYVRPYPCGVHVQPAAEAIFALRAEHAIEPGEIEAIDVATYAIAAGHADTAWDTFAGAQLSFPYVCAVAARDGAITMASFDDVTRSDLGVAELAARVSVSVDDVLDTTYPANRPARVTVVTRRGAFTRTAMEALGSDQLPLPDDGVRAKFIMLTEPVLGATQAAELLDGVWGIEGSADVRAVLRSAVPK